MATNGTAAGSSPTVISGGNLPQANTLPGGTRNGESSGTSTNEVNLERSRTERRRQNIPIPDPTAQLFDDKIPVKEKIKMLNRIATVKDDGTVEVEVPSNIDPAAFDLGAENGDLVDEEPFDVADIQYVPPLQIVILIVGTRGDVQPFIAIGKKLQDYGHRVRLATHANFKEFVLTAGLEFYPLGGDPKVLAEYMVKNKGFLPSAPSEITVQRKQLKDII
ncbi:putative sterol 3-beta-glucosyltransferase [Dioscorea sansibarensis]